MSTAEFNECADLIDNETVLELGAEYDSRVGNEVFGQESPFQMMMNMQNDLQALYASKHKRQPPPHDVKTKGELIDFLKDQKEAFDDEFRELIEAVHGMSRPASERSSGWKKWKSNYDVIRAEGVNENLTDDDKVEVKFEGIDMFHFFMNIMLVLRLDEREMFILYNLKNRENYNRQIKGY